MPHIKQKTLFRGRERRRGRLDPVDALFRTHEFSTAAGAVDTDALLPDPARDETFTILFEGTSTAAGETSFRLGGAAAARLVIGFDGADVVARVGGNAADDAVVLDTADVIVIDKLHRIVLAANPGNGEARLWIDGILIARGAATNGNFGGPFASTDDGLVTIDGSDIIATVSGYKAQLPRQFE